MKRSAAVVSDRTDLMQKIRAAGEHASKVLYDAYALKLERAKRLDGIHSTGLAYQQAAYKADIALLRQHNLITPAEAKATLAAAAKADEETLKSWRRWLSDHKFGGTTIRDVKHYLRQEAA